MKLDLEWYWWVIIWLVTGFLGITIYITAALIFLLGKYLVKQIIKHIVKRVSNGQYKSAGIFLLGDHYGV